MRKLVYLVAVSVDGFIAGPDGSFDFFRFEGDYRDFVLRHCPETLPAPGLEAFGIGPGTENVRFDAVLFGRETYEVGVREGLTNPYPRLRQYVVSRTMERSPDPAVELVRADPLGRVRAMKRQEGKDIWLCGGTRLAQSLEPEIDEYVLKVNPVALGSGIPLFGGEFRPRRLRLTDSFAGENVAVMTYARLP